MNDASLTELERTQGEANMKFAEATAAKEAAADNLAAAEQAYYDALENYTFGDAPEENYDKKEAAKEALEAAKAAQEAAVAAEQEAAKAAQDAADAVEKKKKNLRATRLLDTTYVVHCARIECKCGMRESYLTLGNTHGVKTRQIPQMTIKDWIPDTNIINFGGCFSPENPSVKEAAEMAVHAAQDAIEKKKEGRSGFGKFMDSVIDFFVDDKEVNVDESLLQMCVGECRPEFPPNPEWKLGHKKVTVNGESVLLRRCSIMCNHGGCITILFSGQPD